MKSLDEWLAYQTRLHPQAIDLGLERPRAVLQRLQWQPPRVPVITVAGTNGKGSVSGYCASILAAAGYRVGLFTSPHLRDYRERIRVHDQLVGADALVAAFDRIERARGDIGLTFFEFNTLAALLVFDDARLDAWVLEIGMGGRLDAVNVVDPDVAIVVSIGFDHQEYLGTTIEAIAREKAGIFRAGRPAVLGSREIPPVVGEIAAAMGAPLKRPGKEYRFAREGDHWQFRGSRWKLDALPVPALKGATQIANAAAALAALEEIDTRLPMSPAAVSQGLQCVRLAGRFELIGPVNAGSPSWILDVAHNPAAAEVLAQNLREWRIGGRTLAVCGILGDKDAAGVARALRDDIDAWWCVPTEGERGRSAAALAALIEDEVRQGKEATPVNVAESTAAGCAGALGCARPEDRIVVFGSFHTVGPAIDWLEAHDLLPPEAVREYTATPRGTHA